MAITAVRFGINEGTKEEITKYAVGGVGGFVGFGISEFTGEFISQYAGLEGTKATITRIFSRLLLFGVFFGLSLYAPAGWITWLLAGAGVGSFAGIFMDLYKHFEPAGITGSAQKAALTLREGSFRQA